MKNILLATLAFFTLLFISCNKEKKTLEKEVTTIDSIEAPSTKINHEGEYEGTLPCILSDCKEIELSIKLLPDNHYVYSTKRVGIDEDPLFTTGVYDFDSEKQIITLDEIANVPNSYRIEDKKLRQLDRNKQVVNGPDSEKLILYKK